MQEDQQILTLVSDLFSQINVTHRNLHVKSSKSFVAHPETSISLLWICQTVSSNLHALQTASVFWWGGRGFQFSFGWRRRGAFAKIYSLLEGDSIERGRFTYGGQGRRSNYLCQPKTNWRLKAVFGIHNNFQFCTPLILPHPLSTYSCDISDQMTKRCNHTSETVKKKVLLTRHSRLVCKNVSALHGWMDFPNPVFSAPLLLIWKLQKASDSHCAKHFSRAQTDRTTFDRTWMRENTHRSQKVSSSSVKTAHTSFSWHFHAF